jgi:hypothetical protein
MGEKESSERFTKEWIDLFSDPDRVFKEEGILLTKDRPLSLLFALGLEFFLMAGEQSLKEFWGWLPLEEQKALRIEILKCYLFQPLFIRLFPEEKPINLTPPLLLKRQGKLLLVERGTGSGGEIGFYYPLVHHRLWPGLLSLNQEGIFSSEEILQGLEPELIIAASSTLKTIRQRAETLRALQKEEEEGEIPFSMGANQQKPAGEIEAVNAEDAPAGDPEEDRFPARDESAQPSVPVPDISPVQPAKPQKRKKKKPVPDQMDLFG